MGKGYTVKIWYGSGAFEKVTDVPLEAASRIFDDTASNSRVETVELHRPDGAIHIRTGRRGPNGTTDRP